MIRRLLSWFDSLQESAFKRVPEGWVYRAPNPWLFGFGPCYLLNEAQKAEIAAHHRRLGRFLVLGMIGLVVVAVAVSMSLGFDLNSFATLAASILIGLLVGLVFTACILRAVRPVIAGLQPTTQQITMGDIYKAQATMFSRRFLLFFGLLSLALFAFNVGLAVLSPAGRDVMSLYGTVMFGLMTIFWCALYIAKRKQPAV